MNSCQISASTSNSQTPGWINPSRRRKARDGGGLLDELHFDWRFDRPQVVHDRRRAFVPVQWEGPAAPFAETRIPGLNDRFRPQVLVGVEVNPLGLERHRPEHGIELRVPVDGLDTGNRRGFFLGVFLSFPQGDLLVGLPEKQDFLVLFLPGIGEDDESALLLVDPR
jgi:hypothetical protein